MEKDVQALGSYNINKIEFYEPIYLYEQFFSTFQINVETKILF
jgi:hypothetical protein